MGQAMSWQREQKRLFDSIEIELKDKLEK